MMRDPDLHLDGWMLGSGEERHAAAPQTFWIPDRISRESLQPGDYAKLIFCISVADNEAPEVERMWVLVRGRVGPTYFGILENEPGGIEENDELWVGTEVPFRAEHIIDIKRRDEESIDLAAQPPRRAWPR